MSGTMPNIAFVSTAHIHTRGYLEYIAKATDGPTAYAIWDDIPDRGRRYATNFQSKFVADLDVLLRDPEVDGFVIAAENTRHLPLFKRVVPVGKPVLCDKPLVTTTGEVREVVALFERHPGTKVLCGYFQPFGGQMQAAAKLVNEGAFGKITRVRFRKDRKSVV